MAIIARTPRFKNPVYAHYSEYPWDEDRWPNFRPLEFACRRTHKLAVHPEALDKLQAMRTAIGKPFYVNSGYRSPEHNATLAGAASTSFHMDGIAFDISMRNHDPYRFVELAKDFGFDGIGTYPGRRGNFVHVDTRGYKARWGDPF